MIVRGGQYWQTLLADLALILFIVSASSLDKEYMAEREGLDPAGAQDIGDMQIGVVEAAQNALSLSIWRNVANSPPLGEWLEYQNKDPRMSLVIAAEYADQDRDFAWAEAADLAAQADAAGVKSRIEMRPGDAGRVSVSLEYDGGMDDFAAELAEANARQNLEGEPSENTDEDETGLNFAEFFSF